MTVSEPKPCWECFKKRRVCDFSRPACRKCVSRGVICPGYDQKPLKWLQPGQTRSKGRRARDEAGPVIVRRHGNVVPPSLPLIETQSFEAVVYCMYSDYSRESFHINFPSILIIMTFSLTVGTPQITASSVQTSRHLERLAKVAPTLCLYSRLLI